MLQSFHDFRKQSFDLEKLCWRLRSPKIILHLLNDQSGIDETAVANRNGVFTSRVVSRV
jgi:hypothetical protein